MDFTTQRFNRGLGIKSSTSSPFSRSTSAMSVSGRSNASTLQIATHSDYQIETFGLPYPVQVSEALTFGKSAAVSVSCSSNGWAWAVFDRKLYVWQYREPAKTNPMEVMTPQRRTLSGQCRILTLPHSDIGHKAQLITVIVSEGHQMASCLASSPTGEVRYWPSIANDGASIDEHGILDGQEFDQLLILSAQNYLLVTTTCRLVLLQLQHTGGRQSFGHREIRATGGFFSGIGRKIFASIVGSNSGEKENKLIKACGERVHGEIKVTILADQWLQEWSLADSADTFKNDNCDTDILKKVREFYIHSWKGRDVSDTRFWLLDMQMNKGMLFILAAGVNLALGAQIEFSLLAFVHEESGLKTIFGHILRGHKELYTESMEENSKLKFIVSRGVVYVYEDTRIFPIHITGDPEEADRIEFKSQGDKILSAAAVNGFALFFSRNYGVISITPSDFDPNDTANTSMSPDILTIGMPLTPSGSFSVTNFTTHNLSMYDYDPADITSSNNDIVNQIKSAFIYNLKRSYSACQEIVEPIIKTQWNGKPDSALDRAIVTIAKDIAEDVPSADPRWLAVQGEETHPLGSSTSLQIIQQLRDKKTAITYFVNFLKSSGLWDRLSSITDGGVLRPSHQVIVDINEKIIAAIALKNVHNRCSVVEDAIEIVLKDKKVRPIENLTNQDLFYVKVTHVQDILYAFMKLIQNHTVHETPPVKMQEILIEINVVVLAMLNEIQAFRLKNSTPGEETFEYLPWTSIEGKNGAYDPIIQLVNYNLKQNSTTISAPDVRQKYFLQLSELVDFVLSSKRSHLESVSEFEKRKLLVQKFETLRGDLILPFVQNEQYELATKLSEKYHDFQTLVMIADKTNNQQRLAEYNEKFRDQNFSQFAINWHLRQNKQSSIFERFRHDPNALESFLGDHPSLAWIQLFQNGDFNKAAHILFALAQNEKDHIGRKKTILSLAKLSALASETKCLIEIDDINAELVLIQHQEHLSKDLLNHFGYDPENQKVLTPEEIIHLYISEENTEATEEDFRKALELLPYVELREESRIKIWCAAILKDSWSGYDVNQPLETMQNLIFFKLIDLCFLLDHDLESFLPPIEYLLNAPELEKIKNDQQFQFLIKFGYEHIFEAYSGRTAEEI